MKLKSKKLAVLVIAGAMITSLISGCQAEQMDGQKKTNVAKQSSETNSEDDTAADKATETDKATTTDGELFDATSKDVVDKTNEIESLIDNYFYFEQDEATREESYYDGLMNGLDDPYSVYYTPEEYKSLLEDDGGEYAGIGAVVSRNQETENVYVVRPIVNSPAEEAGLLPMDIIVAVGDVDVTSDMELDEVVSMIRGEAGTTVTLKIYREGEDDYRYVDVTRAIVENVTVSSEMLDNKIGYVKVEQFIENTPEQFEEQIDTLIKDGAESLIIDLRDNPGGLVTAVTEMCDYIIKDGTIVSTKDKDGNVLETWEAKDDHFVDLPMAVIVNGNSASASEIFTGCMKDHGVAKIVGTTTYGKGIVQSVVPLSDGSAIKITIAKYFTPNANDIHKIGIKPDYEVDLTDEQKVMITIPHDEDGQLQKAIEVLSK